MIGGFWFAAWHSLNVHTRKKVESIRVKERNRDRKSLTIVLKWEMTVGTQMENGRKRTTEHSNNHRIESVGIDWISKCKRASTTWWQCVKPVYKTIWKTTTKNSFSFFSVSLSPKWTPNTHAIRRHWHYLIRFSWCDPNQLRPKASSSHIQWHTDSNAFLKQFWHSIHALLHFKRDIIMRVHVWR